MRMGKDVISFFIQQGRLSSLIKFSEKGVHE